VDKVSGERPCSALKTIGGELGLNARISATEVRGWSKGALSSLFVLPVPLPMPSDFITLSDMPQAVLGITCNPCQRREQFDVEALEREHGGDVKMPELLSRLAADCPRQRQRAFSV
jgi:hypothetical protein